MKVPSKMFVRSIFIIKLIFYYMWIWHLLTFWFSVIRKLSLFFFTLLMNKKHKKNLGKLKNEIYNVFSMHWFQFAFSSVPRYLCTWNSDIAFRGIGHWYLIIQILEFGKWYKLINISTHVTVYQYSILWILLKQRSLLMKGFAVDQWVSLTCFKYCNTAGTKLPKARLGTWLNIHLRFFKKRFDIFIYTKSKV